MADKQIKVLIVGAAGEMGRACTRFLVERGATVVAGIGRSRNIGDDMGELAGVGKLGVAIRPSDELEAALAETKPDVVLIAAGSMQQTAGQMRAAVCAGANVATLAEEAYFPTIDEPALTAELDALAKEHGVSIIGMGMQDVNWSNQALVMAANCHKLHAMYSENWCILDHCGDYECNVVVGVDKTEDEFFEQHKGNLNPRSPYTYALYEIADEMGLHVTREENARVEPIIAEEDYDATETAFGKVIPAGKTIGAVHCTTLQTEEGISITGKEIYSFAVNGQPGENIWRFEGEPCFEVVTDDPRPDIGTTTDVVNRLPDIIKAPAGFLTVKDLPKPIYRCHPLPEYL